MKSISPSKEHILYTNLIRCRGSRAFVRSQEGTDEGVRFEVAQSAPPDPAPRSVAGAAATRASLIMNGGNARRNAARPSCEHAERKRLGSNSDPESDAISHIRYILRTFSSR